MIVTGSDKYVDVKCKREREIYDEVHHMKEVDNRISWIYPELDFEDSYQEEKYEDMIRASEENAQLLLSLCKASKQQEMEENIRFGSIMLGYFVRSLQEDIEKQAILAAGKLLGYMETLDRLQFAGDQKVAAAQRAKRLGTKHLDEVIFALETHGTLTQEELSKILQLQKSTMSEALKKIRETELVQASSYGKYKIYSLTEEGIHYGAALRKKKTAQPQLQERTATRPDAANVPAENNEIATVRNSLEQAFVILKGAWGNPFMREFCLNRLQGVFGEHVALVRKGNDINLCSQDEFAMTQLAFSVEGIDIKNSKTPTFYGKPGGATTFDFSNICPNEKVSGL